LADASPADEATTAMAMPVGQTARIPIETTSRRTSQARRRPAAGLLLPAASLLVVVLAAALLLPRLGTLLGGTTGPSSGPSAALASGSPSIAPSASPSIAASPSVAPSPSIDPAIAALDEVDAAIAAAKGGPNGLKGKEANDLESQAAAVRRALAEGNRRAALDAARKLDKRISDVADKIGRDQAARLKAASSNLLHALGG
jgi:hypothetical protein